MPETREFIVSPEDAGRRLDVFLARHMPEWSRSQLQRQIRSGLVTIGPRTVYKAGEAVAAGDRVSIRAARRELRAVAEDLPLAIVYEDDDLVVVDKPAGMVVHVGAGVRSGTLVNALLHHISSLSRAGGELRPGIVHRLDKMTSGLVLVAKNDLAHRQLTAQFKSREIHKTYVALVHGRVSNPSGEIVKSVGRDPIHRVRMRPGGIGARGPTTRAPAHTSASRRGYRTGYRSSSALSRATPSLSLPSVTVTDCEHEASLLPCSGVAFPRRGATCRTNPRGSTQKPNHFAGLSCSR